MSINTTSEVLFIEGDKLTLTFTGKSKKPRKSMTAMEQSLLQMGWGTDGTTGTRQRRESPCLPHHQTSYKAIVIKKKWYGCHGGVRNSHSTTY
jgi:hypothetical protein